MTPETTRRNWDAYSKAWTDISSAEREVLMREVLADHVTYTSPDSDGRGRDGLAAVIADFQRQYPGAYFETDLLLEQHNQSLADWTMRDRAGAALLKGRSYVRYGEQGLMEHLAGFWPR